MIDVWCMKCIGYDAEWHKSHIAQYPEWLIKYKAELAASKNSKRKDTKEAGKKRKRNQVDTDDEAAAHSSAEHDGSDETSDVGRTPARSKPKGTRRRQRITPN